MTPDVTLFPAWKKKGTPKGTFFRD